MVRWIAQLCVSLLSLPILMGCGLGTQQKAIGFKSSSSVLANDFLKSQIIVNGKGLADGTTQFVALVRLLNSNSTPVVGFTPTFAITSGLGLTGASSCSVSDNTGTAVCLLFAATAGIRTFKVTNVTQTTLQKDIEFINPSPSVSSVAVASSQSGTGTGGWKIQGSVAAGSGQLNATGAGGWSIQNSMQGVLSTTQ